MTRATNFIRYEVDTDVFSRFGEVKFFFTIPGRGLKNPGDPETQNKLVMAFVRRIAHVPDGRLLYMGGYRQSKVIAVEDIKEQIGLINSGTRRYIVSVAGAAWTNWNEDADAMEDVADTSISSTDLDGDEYGERSENLSSV